MCSRPAALQCSKCGRKVCVGHAIESEDSRKTLCSYCAILANGLWPRVRPVPGNRSEPPERWVPEERRLWRYLIDPRALRLRASPEAWGLPITVTFQERGLEGYCNQIGEGGLGVFLPEKVPVGSVVSVQFVVPPHSTKLHVQAVVRYRVGSQHGLEFISLNEGKRVAIRQFCNELPPLPDKRLKRPHRKALNRKA